jgi:hypothetical protein
MKLTVTEISIHSKDESPIFGELATKVSLNDEGNGPFVCIKQETNHTNEIRLDFDDIPQILKAIEMLREGLNSE